MISSISLVEVRKVFPASIRFVHRLFSSAPQPVQSGDKIAVDRVTLSIGQGESLGIVGSNGAGKSTLLHMIAGLSAQTSGTIEVNGKVTAVMTLGVGLREELSGRENIYVDGEIQGKTRAEIDEFIDKIIDFADLGSFIDHPVRTYSTGMKSRLGFSMISYIDPEILIIDEALSAGDASFGRKAASRIREICARGRIGIIVSHGMQAIREICNRCLWMENGQIVMDGSPEEVTRAYIDSVRSEDESRLLDEFRKYIGAHSLRLGWTIDKVGLFDVESGEQRSMLEAGKNTRLEISAGAPLDAMTACLRVRITRLDGLLLFNQEFPVNDYRLKDQSIGLEIEMAALVLGTAVYRLDVSLEDGSTRCAESSNVFEVFTADAPTGGKPMLLYPVTAISHPVDPVKEVN